MKRKDLFNFLAFFISKRKLRKSFKLNDFNDLYDFAQNFNGRGYYDRISLNQFKSEFKEFSEYIKTTKPEIVVEIGTKKGGSFFMWARFLKPKQLISIDLPDGIHGGGFPKQKIPFLKYFLSDSPNSKISIILGDSHKDDTINKLKAILSGNKIDFLFIDGDHRYDGVKSDFYKYKDLVKEGGTIAFHDIVISDHHHNLNCFVDVLWHEIKNNYEHKEFIQNKSQDRYGIGVLIYKKD